MPRTVAIASSRAPCRVPHCRRRRTSHVVPADGDRVRAALPGRMSLTSLVLAALPLLRHSSCAVHPVVGGEEQGSAHSRQVLGVELALPGWMSLTRTVPVACRRSSRAPAAVDPVVGREEQPIAHRRQVAGIGAVRIADRHPPMSLTRAVPAAVPSLFQSSRPWSRRRP